MCRRADRRPGRLQPSTVTFEGGTDDDSACIDIPLPDISVTKVAKSDMATLVSGNTYEAQYTVTVTNNGDGPGSYSLDDLPDFGTGANVVGSPVRSGDRRSGRAQRRRQRRLHGDGDIHRRRSMPDSERECFTQPTPRPGRLQRRHRQLQRRRLRSQRRLHRHPRARHLGDQGGDDRVSHDCQRQHVQGRVHGDGHERR